MKKKAFQGSSIKSIIIPRNVIYLGSNAFSDCDDLHIISIEENSRLNSINQNEIFIADDSFLMIPNNFKENSRRESLSNS